MTFAVGLGDRCKLNVEIHIKFVFRHKILYNTIMYLVRSTFNVRVREVELY